MFVVSPEFQQVNKFCVIRPKQIKKKNLKTVRQLIGLSDGYFFPEMCIHFVFSFDNIVTHYVLQLDCDCINLH